ncbi:hypothetical protein HYS48_04855 [Candidatus Woesearchaeota archaeon]|nr:hypothetical protein [Candidatus Woesearchaeota archaeon]
MATILDASFGLLGKFTLIFSFVLVVVVIYGILSFTKAFGDNKMVQGLLALLFGLFVLIMPGMSEVISLFIPWITLLLIILIFLLLFFKLFGATDKDFMAVLGEYKGIVWTIISFVLLIGLWAVTQVYYGYYQETPPGEAGAVEQAVSAQEEGNITKTFGAVFFHPKVLGVVFILLFSVFMISILTAQSH